MNELVANLGELIGFAMGIGVIVLVFWLIVRASTPHKKKIASLPRRKSKWA